VPRRKNIPADERLKLWVRSGGRCALCKRYLLEGDLTLLPLYLGESAHVVGQQDNVASPRGKAALPANERDLADNLILLCPDHHTEVDKKLATSLITVEWLTEQKVKHEAWIRKVTGLDPKRTTTVLRLVADLRGRSVELDRVSATAAVVRGDARFAEFYLSADNAGIEIDLRQMPGEATPSTDYWRRCQEKIDEVIDHKLVEAVRGGHVTHLSVFAFARLPLLVYLGSKLDDTYEVEVYQRQRSDESWGWPGTDAATFTTTGSTPAGQEAAALILNVSGTIDPADLPAEVRDLPRFVVAIDGAPGVDAITSRASLDAFEAAVRGLFASLEEGGKVIRRLHVFAALPISAAVVLGRAHDRHVHPSLVLYDRTDGAYSLALEISS
jgi:hypothetical protein